MVVCVGSAVPAVRQGSSRVFVTAAIDFGGAVTLDELLGTALQSLTDGADAVITARRLDAIRLLAEEDIPVMGHLGFVPKKSTLYGEFAWSPRPPTRQTPLWTQFQRLEDAGAFTVEYELIPAEVMAEINARSGLATISLGSGPAADVMSVFGSDICGESERRPRHARAYGDLRGATCQDWWVVRRSSCDTFVEVLIRWTACVVRRIDNEGTSNSVHQAESHGRNRDGVVRSPRHT